MDRKKAKYSSGATKVKSEKESSIFDIDEYDLWKEWRRQVQLYHRYAKRTADARKELSLVESELDVVTAELDRDIRSDPVKFDMAKITDKSVASMVLLQKEHQKANAKLIEAKHKVDMYQAMVQAMEHRKKALEKLCDLILMDYHSAPKARKSQIQTLRG